MPAGWPYLVPDLAASPWAGKVRPLQAVDLSWPRIGVFCPHPVPWLLGSLIVSRAVMEARGELFWTWTRDYATGDGYLIPLGQRSGRTGPQLLVDDQPHDPDALRAELARGADPAAVAARSRYVDERIRSRVSLRCGTCGLAGTFRSDTIQPIATRLYVAGIRELTLDALTRRVRHAATRPSN